MIKDGIGSVTDAFWSRQVTWPNGEQVSLQSLNCVRFGTTIDSLSYDPPTNQVTLTWGNPGQSQQQTFDAVIVATTTRAMEVLGLTWPLPTDTADSVLSEPVKTAIRNLHLMESSKMFFRTSGKFWQDENGQPIPGMPQDIQTDELPRQVYCLDYGPDVEYGVVLISYTWGDDSAKLLGLPVEKRLELFTEIINVFCPQFAQNLVPDGPIFNVDWETEMNYYGAFKLQYPGQDPYAQDAYFQFQSVLDSDTDCGVYLAGDSVSWAGGWTEGALHTGLNAACAVVQRFGGAFNTGNIPLKINPQLYTYSDS
jgi:tryptophan 2-monooxygenase